MAKSIYDELRQRELVFQESDGLRDLLKAGQEPVRLYAGFDPTADSLHVGNLVPLIALRRFQEAGHHPIALAGGGTGLIGDPSGKTGERPLNEQEVVAAHTEKIRVQLERFLDFSTKRNPALLLNNYDWISKLSAVGFLRDLGKHFTVNWMLSKESVKARISDATAGISYAEFSYMVLQACDYLHLAEHYNCRLQIGGSDQWGNITAGIELIRRKLARNVHALTFPLITTSDGKKFGKTEAGTVWLDPARTSPYAFYQFWINVDDRDAVRFLKYFTLLPLEEIEAVAKEFRRAPEQRAAQRRLALEMTRLVHGSDECAKAMQASEALFGDGELAAIDARTLAAALESAPTVSYATLQAIPPFAQLLVDVGLCESKSAARKNIEAKGIYVNNRRVSEQNFVPQQSDFLHGHFLILRRGKKSYAVVRLGA